MWIKHYVEIVKNAGVTYWIGFLFRRVVVNHIERLRLKNKDFSIISQNCVGGVLSHDLGQRFNSPTINLYFPSADYILFLEHLKEFVEKDIEMVESEKRYPKGKLTLNSGESVVLYFPHDKDPQEIKDNWRRRASRINYDNLFVIATDRDGLTEDILKRYSRLPYRRIILLSSKPHSAYSFVKYYPQYKDEKQVPDMVGIVNVFGKREYGQGWDYVKWLNKIEK